jgi:hypothetical protein
MPHELDGVITKFIFILADFLLIAAARKRPVPSENLARRANQLGYQNPVQPFAKKYSASARGRINRTMHASHPARGAYRDRHGVGRAAVDARGRKTRWPLAYGEIVWV